MPDPVSSIASAIAEFSKAMGIWMASRERRYLRAAIDAAERYIHVNEGIGDENKDLSDAHRAKLLKKFRNRFFKFN